MTPEQVKQLIREELQNFLKNNRYAFNKNIQIIDGKNIQLGKDLGTKIGTETSQKLGFFNKAPIIQQTASSQTPATFAANTSGIVNDTATWDGYTIGDLVAILKAFGLIA